MPKLKSNNTEYSVTPKLLIMVATSGKGKRWAKSKKT